MTPFGALRVAWVDVRSVWMGSGVHHGSRALKMKAASMVSALCRPKGVEMVIHAATMLRR